MTTMLITITLFIGQLVTFMVFQHSTVAQTTISLEEYETGNLVFSGYIGEEMDMPVTFCLNVENMSSGHVDWYSVGKFFFSSDYNHSL